MADNNTAGTMKEVDAIMERNAGTLTETRGLNLMKVNKEARRKRKGKLLKTMKVKRAQDLWVIHLK